MSGRELSNFILQGLNGRPHSFNLTGTGFTNRESELMMDNQSRRKIATVLVLSGNLGFPTLIATYANSIRPRPLYREEAISVFVRGVSILNMALIIGFSLYKNPLNNLPSNSI